MKKLFTFLVLMTCFLGAKAVEITDYTVDYTQKGSSPITWKADMIDAEWITGDADGLHFYNPEVTENFYDYQVWIFGGAQLEVGTEYTIKIVAKVSEGSADVRCRIGDWGGGIANTIAVNSTDYQEYTFTGAATVANCGLLVQFGDYVGTVSFKSVTITHDGKEEKPVNWIPVEEMVNGDAESAWPAWALEEEGGINANWRGERTAEICAWSLTMGRNFDDQCPASINGDSFRSRPFPADIEADPDNANNHVFAVHVTEIAPIDDDNSIAWSNQFWIQAPKTFKNGEQVKVTFRYKAEAPASVPTQMHKIYPSNYLNSNGIGDVEFTTEWQDFEKVISWATDGWSIAFNLTNSNREPNVYYFDDLTFQLMDLEEGYFVAASNSSTGIEYDFDAATKFVEDPSDPEVVVATVGTMGKENTWVNEVMISTVYGNDKAFKSATIKPSGKITGDDDTNWTTYELGSQYKIKLPAAGVWQIFIAPADASEDPTLEGTGEILFMMLEGEEIVKPDPVDIVTNNTEIIVKGQERQPTAAEQPADEEAGTPAGTGQAWDNQFFIVANREFKTGEKVTLKFKYKAANTTAEYPVKTSTQLHGAPGAYVYWNAIGDVNFAEDWQDFEKTWEISSGDNGVEITCKSIAFNMAEIKEACDYYIKDVQWYLADDELEDGKTYENLINAEGDLNFYVKEGAGTNPYIPSGIINVINDAATRSNVIYNLSGQRVSKDYKGIVIINGRKVVNK